MATSNVGVTTAANFIPEMWADAILNYAEQKFRLKNLVTDLSSEMVEGDILHVPRVTEESATQKVEDTAVVYTANTDGKTDLTVDQHWYSAKRIEDIVKVQESSDLFNMYSRSMGYSLAKKVENFIALLIQSATANDVSLSTDNTLTDAELREGLQKMMDINVDYTDATLPCSPASYAYLLGQEKITWANATGGPAGQVSGKLGQVYGMDAFPSVDWDDDGGTGDETASIFTRESILFAMQIQPRMQAAYDIDHLATRVVADVLFGGVLTQTAGTAAGQIVNFKNP